MSEQTEVGVGFPDMPRHIDHRGPNQDGLLLKLFIKIKIYWSHKGVSNSEVSKKVGERRLSPWKEFDITEKNAVCHGIVANILK